MPLSLWPGVLHVGEKMVCSSELPSSVALWLGTHSLPKAFLGDCAT